jgi:hypothetical protein
MRRGKEEEEEEEDEEMRGRRWLGSTELPTKVCTAESTQPSYLKLRYYLGR